MLVIIFVQLASQKMLSSFIGSGRPKPSLPEACSKITSPDFCGKERYLLVHIVRTGGQQTLNDSKILTFTAVKAMPGTPSGSPVTASIWAFS